MRKLARKLSTGRWLIGLTAVSALFLVVGTLLPGVLGKLFLVLGAGIGALVVVGTITSFKHEATLARSARAEQNASQKLLADQLAALNGAFEYGGIPSHVEAGETEHLGVDPFRSRGNGTVYSPGVITTTPVKDKPHAHTAGRLAATQEMGADSSLQLGRIYHASDSQRQRRGIWLGPVPGDVSEQEGWIIETIAPGVAMGRPNPGASYVVLNLADTACSAWEHLTSSLNVLSFHSVYEFVMQAKRNGAAIVLIREDVPSNLSAGLEQIADIALDGSLDVKSDDLYDSLPVFDFIRGVMGRSGKHSEVVEP